MDFQQCTLDGQDVLRDSVSGIYYTAKEWRQLTTEDSSVSLSGFHGRRTTATRAIKRVITLEGNLQRSGNASETDAVTYLQNLFNLQSDTGSVVGRTLYIKDMYNQEWTLAVKVREPIRFIEYDQSWKGFAWKWAVTLESVSNPIYKSLAEQNDNWQEGDIGWITLPSVLPVPFSFLLNPIECVTVGNTATPARFVITCTDTITAPIKITNATDGTFFALDISATAGDVIIVDSNAQTATKNWASVIASRVIGSTFPMIAWTTNFVVSDLLGYTLDHFTVAVYFRDALLA